MSTIIEPSPSTHDGHPESDAHIPGAHQSTAFYVRIAAILAFITALETSTYWINFGRVMVPMLIILMSIKFFMVVSYFMHLRFDNRLFSYLFYTGLFLAVGVYAAALSTFKFFSGT